jgi:hypothetical protein
MKNLLRASVLALPAVAFAIAAGSAVAADTGPAHNAAGSGDRSVTELGRSATKKAGLTMALSRTLDGVTAKCGSAVREALPGVGRLPGIPVAPSTDYQVPMHDPSAVILLNKQIGDPFGGMTMMGMSLDAAPGTPDAVPQLVSGVADCAAVRQAGGSVRRAQLRRTLYPVTSLTAPSLR